MRSRLARAGHVGKNGRGMVDKESGCAQSEGFRRRKGRMRWKD